MRYLIIEKDKGLFLGTYRQVSLFAKNNIFAVVKVPSFSSEEEAFTYIELELAKDDTEKYGVIAVETNSRYVNIVDIIKQGYGDYTHNLIDCLPMISEEIH
jgi:hypothetical protein